jgi:hypothetical protein
MSPSASNKKINQLNNLNMMMKKIGVIVLYMGALFVSCRDKKPEIFTTADGAVNGYDVVAFFKEQMPVKGDKKYSYEWKDATWAFSNADNLMDFKTDPEKYAPQYGGYCAFGTAAGHKAPTEVDTWTIVGDKLYFNYNKDVRVKWIADQKQLIEKADKNWEEVRKQ